MKKTLIKTSIIIFLLTAACSMLRSQEIDTFRSNNQLMDSTAAMEMFKKQLVDMGEWINIDSSKVDAEAVRAEPSEPDVVNEGFDDHLNKYVVWRPNIYDPDWNPYSYGFWQYTSCGWMWISYYKWGWYTCHYGRWWYSEELGWVWTPGYEWAPAWVDWCYDDSYSYIGWYPVSPREHCDGEHPEHHHHVRHHTPRWVFVHTKDFTHTVNNGTKIDITKVPSLVEGKKIKNTIKFDQGGKIVNEGPDPKVIEKVNGKKIEQVNIDVLNYENNNVGISVKKTEGNTEGTVINGNKGKDGEKIKEGEKTKTNEPTKSTEGVKRNDGTTITKEKEKPKQKEFQWNNDGEKKKENNNTNNNNNNDNNGNKQVEPKKSDPPPPPPPPQKQDDPPKKQDDPPKKDFQKDTPKKDDSGKKGDS